MPGFDKSVPLAGKETSLRDSDKRKFRYTPRSWEGICATIWNYSLFKFTLVTHV